MNNTHPFKANPFTTTNVSRGRDALVILAVLAAAAVAAPQYSYSAPPEDSSEEVIPIVRDDRVHEDDGAYNLDVETGNGIVLSQSGSPDGPEDSVVKTGHYSYTAPDGTFVEIAFAEAEDAARARAELEAEDSEEEPAAPSTSYGKETLQALWRSAAVTSQFELCPEYDSCTQQRVSIIRLSRDLVGRLSRDLVGIIRRTFFSTPDVQV
ncbi:hypothetical protein O3P69_020612 [Scylla paramamosain]|uniref:Uncharacterized protein n=1 Tax=Scylla paramamosain TaxID=85552 RepID=A0AAW0TQU2_SCYPA